MEERKSFAIRHFGLRGVALFEAGKGVLALVLASILLTMRHKDMDSIARHALRALHINPDRQFYHDVIQAAGKVTSRSIWLFVFAVVAYAIIRFVEAGGLWLEREWAEWFALLSGSIYLPWEIYELMRRENIWKWIVFGVNVVIVLYLLWLRVEMHRMRKKRSVISAQHSAKETLLT